MAELLFGRFLELPNEYEPAEQCNGPRKLESGDDWEWDATPLPTFFAGLAAVRLPARLPPRKKESRIPSTSDFGFDSSFADIIPSQPGFVLPIEDIFPELTTINFDAVGDLYAVDGRIYMTLHGEDGLYLFGARDPSVIPEPSAVVLLVLLLGALVCCRRTIL